MASESVVFAGLIRLAVKNGSVWPSLSQRSSRIPLAVLVLLPLVTHRVYPMCMVSGTARGEFRTAKRNGMELGRYVWFRGNTRSTSTMPPAAWTPTPLTAKPQDCNARSPKKA